MVAKLDLYIIKKFWAFYLLALATILGMYVIIDSINRLPGVMTRIPVGLSIKALLSFYISHIPIFLTQFGTAIALIAGALTLFDILGKNEYWTMLASGVSPQRAVLCLVLISLSPSLLFWAMLERAGPTLLPHYRYSELKVACKDHLEPVHNIMVKDENFRTYIFGTYNPASASLEDIWVLAKPGGKISLHGKSGRFVSQSLALETATAWRTTIESQKRLSMPTAAVKTNLTEDVLRRQWLVPELLSSSELLHHADHLDGWPEAELAINELHRRMTDLLESCGLVMLTIPIVLWFGDQIKETGLAWWLVKLAERAVPLMIFGLFFILKLSLGTALSPAAGSWTPVLILTGMGMLAYCRKRHL